MSGQGDITGGGGIIDGSYRDGDGFFDIIFFSETTKQICLHPTKEQPQKAHDQKLCAE